MGLPEASIDLSVSGYADDLVRAAVAKNLTELGQINREQTDSLRAALKSRSLQLHPTAAGRNSMKDYQAACTGAWPAPEDVSLQAKYLGALRTIEGTAKAECRARCQAAEASFALYAPFFRSQAPQRFKVLVFKAEIAGTLLAALETTPMTFTIWRSSSVRWHGFFGDARLMCLKGAGHPSPSLAALFVTFSWGEPPVKTDGTLSPTAPRLPVIIADNLEAVGLPLTSPIWNVDLIQGR